MKYIVYSLVLLLLLPGAVLAQQEIDLPTLYEQVSPSVVYLEIQVANGDEDFFFHGGGLGSGFVYDTEGHIVTNNHVVANAGRITVTFFDGTLAYAEVVGTDPDSDLAVIQVQDVDPAVLIPVSLGDSSTLRVGESVAAIGNPFGQNWTMTTGIISALGRANRAETGFSIAQMIQTDAAINPGNSGGPLLDLQGRVIGVNTMIFSEDRASSGVGFAVPVNTVQRVVPALITDGFYEYTWIGISGGDLSLDLIDLLDLQPGTRGVLVSRISPDGPAEKAGLRGSRESQTINGLTYSIGGDIIIALDETPINGITALISYLAENTRPGDVIDVTVIRDGKEAIIPVTLDARPKQAR